MPAQFISRCILLSREWFDAIASSVFSAHLLSIKDELYLLVWCTVEHVVIRCGEANAKRKAAWNIG
jgi:hypothetical protein